MHKIKILNLNELRIEDQELTRLEQTIANVMSHLLFSEVSVKFESGGSVLPEANKNPMTLVKLKDGTQIGLDISAIIRSTSLVKHFSFVSGVVYQLSSVPKDKLQIELLEPSAKINEMNLRRCQVSQRLANVKSTWPVTVAIPSNLSLI